MVMFSQHHEGHGDGRRRMSVFARMRGLVSVSVALSLALTQLIAVDSKLLSHSNSRPIPGGDIGDDVGPIGESPENSDTKTPVPTDFSGKGDGKTTRGGATSKPATFVDGKTAPRKLASGAGNGKAAPRTDFSDIGEGIGGANSVNPMSHVGRTTVAAGTGVTRGIMDAGAEKWRGVSKRKGNLANTNLHTGSKGGINRVAGLNAMKQNTEKLKTDSKSEHKKKSDSLAKHGGSLLQNNINGDKYDPNDVNEKGNKYDPNDINEKGNGGSELSEKSNVSGKSDESAKSYSDLAPAPNGELLPLRDVHDVFTTFEEEIEEEEEDLKSKEEDLKSKSKEEASKSKSKEDESKKGISTSKPRKKLVAQWTPKGPQDFDTRYFQLLLEMHNEKKKIKHKVADFLDHVWYKFDLNNYHYQSDEQIELMRPKGLWEPERLGEIMNSELKYGNQAVLSIRVKWAEEIAHLRKVNEARREEAERREEKREREKRKAKKIIAEKKKAEKGDEKNDEKKDDTKKDEFLREATIDEVYGPERATDVTEFRMVVTEGNIDVLRCLFDPASTGDEDPKQAENCPIPTEEALVHFRDNDAKKRNEDIVKYKEFNLELFKEMTRTKDEGKEGKEGKGDKNHDDNHKETNLETTHSNPPEEVENHGNHQHRRRHNNSAYFTTTSIVIDFTGMKNIGLFEKKFTHLIQNLSIDQDRTFHQLIIRAVGRKGIEEMKSKNSELRNVIDLLNDPDCFDSPEPKFIKTFAWPFLTEHSNFVGEKNSLLWTPARNTYTRPTNDRSAVHHMLADLGQSKPHSKLLYQKYVQKKRLVYDQKHFILYVDPKFLPDLLESMVGTDSGTDSQNHSDGLGSTPPPPPSLPPPNLETSDPTLWRELNYGAGLQFNDKDSKSPNPAFLNDYFLEYIRSSNPKNDPRRSSFHLPWASHQVIVDLSGWDTNSNTIEKGDTNTIEKDLLDLKQNLRKLQQVLVQQHLLRWDTNRRKPKAVQDEIHFIIKVDDDSQGKFVEKVTEALGELVGEFNKGASVKSKDHDYNIDINKCSLTISHVDRKNKEIVHSIQVGGHGKKLKGKNGHTNTQLQITETSSQNQFTLSGKIPADSEDVNCRALQKIVYQPRKVNFSVVNFPYAAVASLRRILSVKEAKKYGARKNKKDKKNKDDSNNTDDEPKLTISFKNGATFDDLKQCIYGVGENLGDEDSETEGHAEEIQAFKYSDRPDLAQLQEQNHNVRSGASGGVLLGKGEIHKLEGKGNDNDENNGNNDNDIAYLPTRADTHPDLRSQFSSDEEGEWTE